MEDYVHSGALQTMSLADVIQVRDELADLWILIDGTDIVPGMTEQAVRDALSPPAEQYDGYGSILQRLKNITTASTLMLEW